MKAWATQSGATIALAGEFAIKVQSNKLPLAERVQAAQQELRLAHALPRLRRVALELLWLAPERAILTRARVRSRDEPALLMRRLDDLDVTEYLIAHPTRASAVAADVGSLLCSFHGQCRPISMAADAAALELADFQIVESAFHQHLDHLDMDERCKNAVFSAITHARQLLAEVSAVLDKRARQGLRRDCHGDLHADNVHFLRGRATFIDPLPIPHHRANDVAMDLGRLALEFQRLAGTDARRALMDAYARASNRAVPEALIHYFALKALLIDLRTLGKYRARGLPAPRRASHLMAHLPMLASDLSRFW